MNAMKKMAMALALIGTVGGAQAFTLNNLDGTYNNFGGFDWASSGSVWIKDYNFLNNKNAGFTDTFTMQYMAKATGLLPVAGGNNLVTDGLNHTYEYTIFGNFNMKGTCMPGAASCSMVRFDILGGNWGIYYDTTPATFHDPAVGTHVTDGIKIVSGQVDAQVGAAFAPQGPSNPGNGFSAFSMRGSVDFTNSDYIVPDIKTTQALGTLQFGSFQNAWYRPTTFDGVSTGVNSNTSFVAQADSNQSLFVPEPGSLALLGLGMLGFGAIRRRKA